MTKHISYIDEIAADIHAVSPADNKPWDWLPLFRIYAVLALAKGESTTAEDVHNAYSAWASEHSPNLRSLVRFYALPEFVQKMDVPYMKAIHKVARRLRQEAPAP